MQGNKLNEILRFDKLSGRVGKDAFLVLADKLILKISLIPR